MPFPQILITSQSDSGVADGLGNIDGRVIIVVIDGRVIIANVGVIIANVGVSDKSMRLVVSIRSMLEKEKGIRILTVGEGITSVEKIGKITIVSVWEISSDAIEKGNVFTAIVVLVAKTSLLIISMDDGSGVMRGVVICGSPEVKDGTTIVGSKIIEDSTDNPMKDPVLVRKSICEVVVASSISVLVGKNSTMLVSISDIWDVGRKS